MQSGPLYSHVPWPKFGTVCQPLQAKFFMAWLKSESGKERHKNLQAHVIEAVLFVIVISAVNWVRPTKGTKSGKQRALFANIELLYKKVTE